MKRAFKQVKLKDELDDPPVQWGCNSDQVRRKHKDHKPFIKRWKFRKPTKFKNPRENFRKFKRQRYYQRNNPKHKQVPNYRKPESVPARKQIECWICDEKGHIAPKCPKKK